MLTAFVLCKCVLAVDVEILAVDFAGSVFAVAVSPATGAAMGVAVVGVELVMLFGAGFDATGGFC